jgi:Ca-activated chloride channel family protein
MVARRAATMKAATSAASMAPTGVPAGTGPHAGEAPRILQARRQMGAEAAALRAAHDAPEAERVRLLADLATRIDALLAWLGGDPAAAGQLTRLAGLVRRLRACDRPEAPRGAELDALFGEAVRLLTGFATGAGPAARHAFWKRPR